MKKLILLTLAICLATTMQARKWDFTKWSSATHAMLKASAAASYTEGWSDVEKKGDSAPTDISRDNCFWQATIDKDDNGNLLCDGVLIPELEGLYYTNGDVRSLAIAVNYPDVTSINGSGFGPYNGPSYLWLGGGKKNYFLIPNVKPGTIIKMGVESHKLSDARGVNLFLTANKTAGTSGTKLLAPDGSENPNPTNYQDFEWIVPTEAADAMNDDGTWDIQVYNTNGCHIYYITVEDGDTPIEDNPNVAYLYNSTDGYVYDNDLLPQLFAGSLEITPIDLATTDIQRDSLYTFDALMFTNTVKGTEPILGNGSEIIGFVPIINMSADMFKAWDLGISNTVEGVMEVPAELQESPIFENVSNFDLMLAKMQSFTYSDRFALMNDTVYASISGNPVISRWAPKRNDVIFVGADINDINEALALGSEVYTLMINATNIVAATKKAPAKTSAPTINQTYGDGKTTVKLACSTNHSAIYYTLDGTDPDQNSAEYTQELELNTPATVKAIAYALGYYTSDMASADVIIKTQAQKPQISFVREPGKTTITITAAEGTTPYYGFMDTEGACGAYTEPVVMTEPATIYAFSKGDDVLSSEMVSLAFGVDGVDATNIRLDTLGHFDANQTDWWWETPSGSSKVAYYIGKSTPEANFDVDSIFYAGNTGVPSETTPWAVKTTGQVVQWENTAPVYAVYTGENGYYCDAPEDLITIPTKYHITFGGKPSGFDYTGRIESTKKFQGPFDIVTFVGCNNGSATGFNFELQVSADGENWTAVGDSLTFALTQRIWKRNVRHYEGTDEVFVRIAQLGGSSKGAVYDILVMNNGELSKQYVDPQSVVGMKGDANNDGKIDVADITTIAAYILDNSKVPASLDNADANSDGKIDVADITTVAGMILAGK